ncbi:MAG: hypothetical protein ACR2QM_09455 [Longimicrobiales bacterium]
MTDTTNGQGNDLPVQDRRKRGRSPFWVGLGVSVLLHAALIALYPFFGADFQNGALPTFTADPPAESGMEVVRLSESETQEAGEPDDPVEIETPEAEAEIEAPDLTDPNPRFLERYRSAVERLQAGNGDSRLWRPFDRSMTDPTPEEIAHLRLLTAIEAMSDSALMEAERDGRFTDWTYTDDDGKRWGVSPGKLHLGDLAIPMPFGFGPPPDYNGDQARRAFEFNDIDRAAGSRAARASWEERIKVMREARERRRAAEQAENAEPRRPVVRPDTSRSRR